MRITSMRMGLGLAALGRPGYINLGHAADLQGDYRVEAMEGRAWAVLDRAWEKGVRYFDAARSYGRAEDFLGRWISARGLAGSQLRAGSKWGYTYTAGWGVEAPVHEEKDHSVGVLRRQIAESRERLGDSLVLYQIHSATQESGVLGNEAVLDELARLRDGGLVVGLSLSGPRQGETLAAALEVRRGEDRLFRSVQATWNLLEPSAEPMLKEAHHLGWSVIVKEGLASGRLTPRNQEPDTAERIDALTHAAARHGGSLTALALAAALARPWADIVLSGATTPEQVDDNLSALDLPWDPFLDRLLPALAETPDAYWARRSQLPWN